MSGEAHWKLLLPQAYRTLAGRAVATGSPPSMKDRLSAPALFHLRDDRGETRNVAVAHPDVMATLLVFVEKCRVGLGDSLTKRTGAGTRELGRVSAAK